MKGIVVAVELCLVLLSGYSYSQNLDCDKQFPNWKYCYLGYSGGKLEGVYNAEIESRDPINTAGIPLFKVPLRVCVGQSSLQHIIINPAIIQRAYYAA